MALKLIVLVSLFVSLRGGGGTISSPESALDGVGEGDGTELAPVSDAPVTHSISQARAPSTPGSVESLASTDNFTTSSFEEGKEEGFSGTSGGSRRRCTFYLFVFGTVVIGTTAIFGLVGNGLSFLVLFHQRKTSSSMLVLATLAGVDSFLLLTMLLVKSMPALVFYTGWLPSYARNYAYVIAFGWPTVSVAVTMASYITVLIAIHRFVAVCKPFKLSTFASVNRTKLHIAGVVTFAIVYNVPIYCEYTLYSVTSQETNQTFTRWRYSNMAASFYYSLIYRIVLYYVVMFVGPLITLVTITFKISRGLRKARRMRAKMSTLSRENGGKDEISPALVVIVVVYFVCQVPSFLRRFLRGVFPEQRGCGSFYDYFQVIDINIFH